MLKDVSPHCPFCGQWVSNRGGVCGHDTSLLSASSRHGTVGNFFYLLVCFWINFNKMELLFEVCIRMWWQKWGLRCSSPGIIPVLPLP